MSNTRAGQAGRSGYLVPGAQIVKRAEKARSRGLRRVRVRDQSGKSPEGSKDQRIES